MEKMKSIELKEAKEKIHEISFVRGADLFLDSVKDIDENEISFLDKRIKG